MLQTGSHFVIKMFTLFEHHSLSVLALMSFLFEKVSLLVHISDYVTFSLYIHFYIVIIYIASVISAHRSQAFDVSRWQW